MKVKRGLLYTASHEWVELAPYGSWLVEFGDIERAGRLMTAQEYCKYIGKEAEMI